MILSGDEDALDPILTAIHDLVDELAEEHDASGHSIHEETLQLVLMALGDALLGGPMARAFGLPPDRARALAFDLLLSSHTGVYSPHVRYLASMPFLTSPQLFVRSGAGRPRAVRFPP